jgi:hypothetical protein
MGHSHEEIWDYLYRSGPQTVEQIAHAAGVDTSTVDAIVAHEWFQVVDAKVEIAMRKPLPSIAGGSVE